MTHCWRDRNDALGSQLPETAIRLSAVMQTLAALLVATPIFGMSLELDPALFEAPTPVPAMSGALFEVAPAAVDPAAMNATRDLIRKRAKLGKVHKWMGIATWSAMTLTVISGYIQYHNQYGFFAGQGSNPCVTGHAIFGQKQCRGTPSLHLALSTLTGALYFTTFGLSFAMPDPLHVSEGKGRFARRLRTHKILRWVHFGGMMTQILLGVVVANSRAFGLDRANDYKTMRALATVHLMTGFVTYGALTWAGALMAF